MNNVPNLAIRPSTPSISPSGELSFEAFLNLIDHYTSPTFPQPNLRQHDQPLTTFHQFVTDTRQKITYITDFDGSLADKAIHPENESGIPDELLRVIKLLGGVINSARDESELISLLGSHWIFFLDSLFITELGGKIVKVTQDPLIQSKPKIVPLYIFPLSQLELTQIITSIENSRLQKNDITVKLHSTYEDSGQILWTSNDSKQHQRELKKGFPSVNMIYSQTTNLHELLLRHQPVKITIYGQVQLPNDLNWYHNFGGIEVNTASTNKGAALQFLQQKIWQKDQKQLFVVGDDYPDESMLKLAHQGFVVGSRPLLQSDEAQKKLIWQPTLKQLGHHLLYYLYQQYLATVTRSLQSGSES